MNPKRFLQSSSLVVYSQIRFDREAEAPSICGQILQARNRWLVEINKIKQENKVYYLPVIKPPGFWQSITLDITVCVTLFITVYRRQGYNNNKMFT